MADLPVSPAVGKTTLADELASALRAQGREVIRATIDDFLFPRALRYRRGEYRPKAAISTLRTTVR